MFGVDTGHSGALGSTGCAAGRGAAILTLRVSPTATASTRSTRALSGFESPPSSFLAPEFCFLVSDPGARQRAGAKLWEGMKTYRHLSTTLLLGESVSRLAQGT